MARISWMTIATVTVLLVCLVISFAYGWYQLGQYSMAKQSREAVDQQIALQEQQRRELEQTYKSVTQAVAAPDNDKEEFEFLSQLQQLMMESGVRPIQNNRAVPMPLPTISGAVATTKSETSRSQPYRDPVKNNDPNAKPEPSITNLPLGVRALSTNLVVQGPFANIRMFIHRVYNYRYQVRAININTVQINGADDKGISRATLMLTRFVRPKDLAMPNLISEKASGTPTTSNATSGGAP